MLPTFLIIHTVYCQKDLNFDKNIDSQILSHNYSCKLSNLIKSFLFLFIVTIKFVNVQRASS